MMESGKQMAVPPLPFIEKYLPATAIAIFLPNDKNDMLQLTKMTGRSMTIWLHAAFWLVLGVLNLVLSNLGHGTEST